MLQFGDNGLLKKSKEAVDKSKLSQTEELIKMDLLAAYIDAELTGLDKPSNETIKEIVEKHGGTIDESNPNVIQTPNGEIKLDEILNDTSSDTKDPDEINSTIESLNNRITELNSQLQTERNEKNELQNQVDDLNVQVTELNTQVADWKKKAEDGEVTIAEKDTQISNLNTQITTKNEEIEEKTNRIQELEGDVTTLTNEKTTLQTQVNNLNTRLAELEGKQATGDATASDVLAGKTFSNGNGVNLTGTMVNRGTLNFNPSTETTQTIEPGYYSGGTISNSALSSKYKIRSTTDSVENVLNMEVKVEDNKDVIEIEALSGLDYIIAVYYYGISQPKRMYDYFWSGTKLGDGCESMLGYNVKSDAASSNISNKDLAHLGVSWPGKFWKLICKSTMPKDNGAWQIVYAIK